MLYVWSRRQAGQRTGTDSTMNSLRPRSRAPATGHLGAPERAGADRCGPTPLRIPMVPQGRGPGG
ncbi:hypothetical protein GCM10010207_20170 [Streptomyces atratus]|nr:hypothetical protein GCM10010207_20170 [Streptomyces atratus]